MLTFLELPLEPLALLLLCAVAFAAGFIDAIAGGGGLLTLPALLMLVSIAACLWRSSGGVLATMVLLNGICAEDAVLGLWRVYRTLAHLRLGFDDLG